MNEKCPWNPNKKQVRRFKRPFPNIWTSCYKITPGQTQVSSKCWFAAYYDNFGRTIGRPHGVSLLELCLYEDREAFASGFGVCNETARGHSHVSIITQDERQFDTQKYSAPAKRKGSTATNKIQVTRVVLAGSATYSSPTYQIQQALNRRNTTSETQMLSQIPDLQVAFTSLYPERLCHCRDPHRPEWMQHQQYQHQQRCALRGSACQ